MTGPPAPSEPAAIDGSQPDGGIPGVSDRRRTPRSRPSRPKVLATAIMVTLVATLPVFLTGSLAVEIQPDLGFDTAALGVALTGFFVVAALFSIALGGEAERRGWPASMRLAAFASSVALLGIGVLATSWASFAFFLAVGGLAMAVGHPAVNMALATEMSPDRQGLVFGLKHSAVPGAALLSGLALPVFALTLGWRAVFVGAGVLAGTVAAMPPRRARTRGTVRQRSGAKGDTRVDSKPLIVLALGAILAATGASALSAFMVVSLVDSGVQPGTAGLLLAIASVGGLAMRLVVGWWADLRSAGGLGGVAGLLVIGAVGFSMLSGDQLWMLTIGAIIGFGAGWGWNGLYNFAVVKHHPGAAARATSIALTGMYTGAAIGPAAFGLVVERSSFGVAWNVTAGFMLAGAVVMLAARAMISRADAVA